jgi:hypothetical protein
MRRIVYTKFRVDHVFLLKNSENKKLLSIKIIGDNLNLREILFFYLQNPGFKHEVQ